MCCESGSVSCANRSQRSGRCYVHICTDVELTSLAGITNFFNSTSQTSVTAPANTSLCKKTQTISSRETAGRKLLQ
jgi:hypothetical protein